MAMATNVFLFSLTAIPVTYTANIVLSSASDSWWVFAAGCGVLGLIGSLMYLAVRFSNGQHKIKDPFFYVFAVFAFTSVVDIVLALELDGVIENFMAAYVKEGEPYMNTAHGTMINYWDGSGHYFMYLMITTAIVWSQSYREVGLYWVGSILNSMLVLLPGSVSGKFGTEVRASYFLNVPYLTFPFIVGHKLLTSRPRAEVEDAEVEKAHKKSIWKRPLDLSLVFFLCFAFGIAFLRAAVALGSPAPMAVSYLKNVEPYYQDPVLYPKVQALIYWFYFIPYYVCAVYGFLYPGCYWMSDWALIHAGAAAQSQFSHIGASLHNKTPYIYRVPAEGLTTFWVINLALLLLPQIMAWRCITYPAFFETKRCKEEQMDRMTNHEVKKEN